MPTPFTSKFIHLLQTFDEAELKAFERWLQSPWCNTNKNLTRLLTRLKPYYPGFSDTKLTKEKLFRQVLPDGKFSERRMNNLLSEAYLAAEKFLVFQRFSGEHHLQKELLIQEFQGRGLDDWFFRDARREIDRLESREVKDWKDHLGLLRLHRRMYHHPGKGPGGQAGHATIVQMGAQIDLLYLLEKAAVINEMIFQNRLFKEEPHDLPAELKKWFTAAGGIRHPALELYRMRFADAGEENLLPQFLQLQTAFLERFDALNTREQNIHLLSLLNDAKQLIKAGALDITKSLPLYQLGLTTGAVLNQGKMTSNTYLTIVTASNTKRTFDFTGQFTDTYTVCLAEEVRDDCARWAGAHTAYWRNGPEACLAILQGYEFSAPNLQLTGRVLAAQAHFDLYLKDASYQSYLFHYFDTFEKWLNRDKIWSKSNMTTFLRFVQISRTLAKYYTDPDPNPKNLENLLDQEQNIQALNWLKLKREEVLRLKAKRPSRI
ncbi:MAG: hypothetical protein IPM81_08695 [Saprospirales bacterium]|nr:hypothetical protein [Saprospirales bacterium]